MADEIMKTRSIRATDEAFNALKEMAENGEFANQGEAFTALIRLWESEQAKKLIPGRETEIEDFRMHLNSLADTYLKALQLNVETDARVREEYSARMQGQDMTIANLHEQLKTGKELVAGYQSQQQEKETELKSLKADNERLQRELESVKDSLVNKIEEQGALNIAIRSLTAADEKKSAEIESMKAQVARVAELEEMVSKLTAADREQSTELVALRKTAAEVAAVQSQNSLLQERVIQLTNQLHEVEQEKKHALEMAMVEMKDAVVAEKEKRQDRYDALQDKYNELMGKYSSVVSLQRNNNFKSKNR